MNRFNPSDKTYHYFKIESLTFDGRCVICYEECNATCGWKCYICNKCYCDDHNDEKFVCKC